MRARAEVRRAGRRAQAKLNHGSTTGAQTVVIHDEPAVVSATQRVLRRIGAVVLTFVVLTGGGALLWLTAFSGGKGYQVAPVLALMVLVMFGLPALAVLVRHVQNVWHETASDS